MKRFLLSALLLLCTTLLFAQQTVYTIKTVPDPKQSGNGYVSDPNNYLSVSEKQELNSIIKSLEDKSTAQIAVVILPSIGQEVPKSFAVDLFEEWGIGQADVDNGLLILTVMDQRRTEFETGYGLESSLTDVVLFRIGTYELVPHFKRQAYGQGLIAAVTKIKSILENPDVLEEIKSDGITVKEEPLARFYPVFGFFGIYALLCIVFGFLYYTRAKRIHENKEDFYNKYVGVSKLRSLFLAIIFPLPFIFLRRLFAKRMEIYRYHPRFSKINGKELFLKSEEADDEYLYLGELKEEEIDSVDYDVWCTDNDDDVLILPYKNRTTPYHSCPECDYTTYKLMHTKTLSYATYHSTGLKEREYSCVNCNYFKVEQVIIPMKVKQSSSSSSSFGGGSSSGGSSWGGGSSGGGGAGVSW